VVRIFTLKDDTPGCTIEAMILLRWQQKFAALDTVIIGVSKTTAPA